MQLTDDVKILKSVGQARLALLHNLGIYTIEDLLEYFPRDYLDRSIISSINELYDGQAATIRTFMAGQPQAFYKNGKDITKIAFNDGTGRIEITWFNQPYLRRNFKSDVEYFISGRVRRGSGAFTIETPEVEAVAKNAPRGTSGGENLSAGRIVPIYPLTAGVSQKVLRGLIKQVLDSARKEIAEFMPQNILSSYNLSSRDFAIRNIHFPECDTAYFKARRRLVFEELFLMQGAMASAKGHLAAAKGRIFDNIDASEILDTLPYDLTDDQKKVVSEISVDLQSGYAANRLIQGDVGSGKTAVAMIFCFLAIKNGVQAVLMAPTETLAIQHHQSFLETFGKFGINVELLVGSVKPKQKTAIKQRLKSGEIDIIIGTHALIQDNVEFANLGLVITDEQHRFGVRQRGKLNDKGEHPHILVMTATPIPRSLAMVLYGDMDISTIKQLPPGRQKIDTFCVTSAYHERIFKFIRDEVEKGHQAYIICPLIDESENEDFKDITSVLKFAEELKNGGLAGISLKLLHGRMKPEEKNEIMTSFAAGETKVLVSTTVIEVGINVPNATIILIENAERFGLSQLHQLRGRVGRSGKKSYCILITDSKNEVTKKRMDAMVGTNDGFEISELDLQLRGPGDFFGTMQHGIPQMRLANLYRDMQTLEETRDAISRFFITDTRKFHIEHRPLKEKIEKILGNIQKISL
ncbi:MAG: ATP-dependent DNA helicase RecG [Defluviitaleaceae bacterium]|nr:ATP-dependent DNA helicase RecG [Defluviitaleaceae bacterium]